MEEIMVKVAELDYFMRTRVRVAGDGWVPSIKLKAQTNFVKCINESKKSLDTRHIAPLASRGSDTKGLSASPAPHRPSSPEYNSANEQQNGLDLEGFIQSGNFNLKIVGLRKDSDDNSLSTLDLQLKDGVNIFEIIAAIKDAGFKPPTYLCEEPDKRISVTEGDSVYDATIPGGLKVNKSEPLLWWWNEYTAYHGLTFATTPSQTITEIQHRPTGVLADGVRFIFHRTLRVPEGRINNLPASLGSFPLIAVDSNSRGIPRAIQERGGFLMPMFRREAVWIQLKTWSDKIHEIKGPAVKISVGGVNALSGISTRSIEPPKFGAEQDYVVIGRQPWLDGIVSGPGVIRQFVAADLGSGYTVEEQVTGKAEIGGFQFDIFPRRPEVNGKFLWAGRQVDCISSPSELGMVLGDQLVLERPRKSTKMVWSPSNYSRKEYFKNYSQSKIVYSSNEWSLSDYRRRVSSTATVEASYEVRSSIFSKKATTISGASPRSPASLDLTSKSEVTVDRSDILGLAAGGQIAQKIYRDADSPRVYDQENGRRFYVHIVTPELWETITGVLPPITPITRDMYIRNGVNWYKLFDDYVDSITTVSEALSNVLSVTQLDEKNQTTSARSQLPDLIDPKAPPGCSIHSGTESSCVFRPCSHVACSSCLGLAMLGDSKCPKCQAGIEKFVRMQTPIKVISHNKAQGEWSVKETERLATNAAGSDKVIVIHPVEDRPSPLYSSGR